MLKTSAALTIAVAAVALAGPGDAAAETWTAALYGGGTIVDRAPTVTAGRAAATTAIGLVRSMDAKTVGVRVSFSLSCGRYAGGGWRSTDVVTRTALAADGTFHLHGKRLRTREVGSLTLDIDGKLTPSRADGTARVRTHFPCGGQVRPWTARPIDNLSPDLSAPAPADGVLYGVTDQDAAQGGAPHGVVAKVDDGGTSIHLYMSYTTRCRGVDRKGGYTSTIRYQSLVRDTPLGPTGFRRVFAYSETAAQRRRHRDYYSRTIFEGGFRGPALYGVLSDLYRYAKPGDHGRCLSGEHRFKAIA